MATEVTGNTAEHHAKGNANKGGKTRKTPPKMGKRRFAKKPFEGREGSKGSCCGKQKQGPLGRRDKTFGNLLPEVRIGLPM